MWTQIEIDHSSATMEGSGGTGSQLLVTVSDAAPALGVGRSTVYELLYSRRLPSAKIGNRRRIRQRDLEAFVRDLVEVS